MWDKNGNVNGKSLACASFVIITVMPIVIIGLNKILQGVM